MLVWFWKCLVVNMFIALQVITYLQQSKNLFGQIYYVDQ